MKAIVQERYGSADVLELRDIDRPVPADDEVLVRVRAAAVNAYDWHVMRGDPYLARLSLGFGRPRARVRGRDFAGVVETVGKDVRRVRPGDEVYGDLGSADGAFAEYASVPERGVERKPANLTFEQAAALPLAGNTALKGLRDLGQVRAGQRVLVNGASGGVGTFAIQLARTLGAEVTGVCRTRNVELVTSLGADHVIDYTKENFTRGERRYDVVFDLVGNHSLAALRRVVTPEGRLVLSGGGVYDGGSLLGPMALVLQGTVMSRVARQRRVLLLSTEPDHEILTALRELAEAGSLTPVVDRTYPLDKAPAAIHYLEHEHARAKVVITV
ncbi:NAD(P)-dependent alcohol dehydrogenase [Actinophytocola sediminis]